MRADDVLDGSRLAGLLRLGGPRLLERLVDSFRRNAPERAASARAAAERGDWAAAGLAVHSLVSSAGNLGAFGLQRLCAEAERRILEGDTASVPALLGTIEQTCAAVASRLEKSREMA